MKLMKMEQPPKTFTGAIEYNYQEGRLDSIILTPSSPELPPLTIQYVSYGGMKLLTPSTKTIYEVKGFIVGKPTSILFDDPDEAREALESLANGTIEERKVPA